MSRVDMFSVDQLGMVDVAMRATGGAGTSGDPWTGWAAAVTTPNRYYFRNGYYGIASTLAFPAGAQFIGESADFLTPSGAILTAESMSGATAAVTFADVDGGLWRNIILLGRDTGTTGGCVRFSGTCRHCVFENVLVTDETSDGGCFSFEADYSYLFRFANVRTGGNALYGFSGDTLTNATFDCVYANGHGADGWNGRFDNCGFVNCHADSNGNYGWNFAGGLGATLTRCAAEMNGRSAARFSNYWGAQVHGLFSSDNGDSTYPSVLSLDNGVQWGDFRGLYEPSAGTGVVDSVGSVAGNAPSNISFGQNYLQAGYDAACAKFATTPTILQVEADLGDPASIADGASWESADITVAGAAVGDFVVPSFNGSLAGLMLTGYVRAADKVRIVLWNKTGDAVDLPYQYFRIRVLKWA